MVLFVSGSITLCVTTVCIHFMAGESVGCT